MLFLVIPAKAGTSEMGTGLLRCDETGKRVWMAEEIVIRAQGLTKRYATTIAVDHIDLDVRAGEIVGILGPNGSGKTTTILMLLGLTEPTEGRAEVAGFDPLRDPLEVKRRVGYLPDSVGFYDGLSARDNLAYTGRLAGLSRREIDQRFAAALARVGLPDVGRDRVAEQLPRRGAAKITKCPENITNCLTNFTKCPVLTTMINLLRLYLTVVYSSK